MNIAFLAIPPALTTTKQSPALPTFKPRPWFRSDRLDARPAAWSLRNRPEDWEWGVPSHYTVVHKPSKHEFWIGSGYGFYRLWSANCSCNSQGGRFQRFQQGMFGRAFKYWRKYHAAPAVNAEQFAAHFVTANHDTH